MATELKRKSRDLSMDLPGSKAHSLWSISLHLIIPPMSNSKILRYHIPHAVL